MIVYSLLIVLFRAVVENIEIFAVPSVYIEVEAEDTIKVIRAVV